MSAQNVIIFLSYFFTSKTIKNLQNAQSVTVRVLVDPILVI
jgi:hypothetical protein